MYENDVVIWLLQDQVNSTTITTDANGNMLSETRYSAFGEIRYANGRCYRQAVHRVAAGDRDRVGLQCGSLL
jgi:hypothetical protein